MTDLKQIAIPNNLTGLDTGGGAPTDIVGAISDGLKLVSNLFPPGALRDFFSNPIGAVTKLISNLGGRTYQTGQYRLGERFMRHILQQEPGGNQNVPDEIVPQAQIFFTSVLGVDINNDEDLQSLYSGVDSYFLRPDKTGIPKPAVQRAVEIMKYWPMTNPQNPSAWYVPWPIAVIYKIESDPATMSYFSKLINKQMPIALQTKTGDSNIVGQDSTLGKSKTWIYILIGVAVLVIAIILIKRKK